MSNLAITSTDVIPVTTNYDNKIVASGVTIVAGEVCTLDSNGKVVKADNGASTTAGDNEIFLALSGGTAGQIVTLLRNNSTVTVSAVLTAGTPYYLSATAGKICPHADLVSTNIVVQLGYAISTTSFKFSYTVYGVTL